MRIDQNSRQAWAEIATPAILLLVPFWSFLRFHSYSAFRPAALSISLALGMGGSAYGWLISRTSSKLLKTVLIGLALLASVDLSFHIDRYELYVALGIFVVTWILQPNVSYIAIAMALAFGASDVVFGTHPKTTNFNTTTVKGSEALPPLVHIILDEHIGIGGMPTDFEEGARIKEEVVSAYVQRNFRLFPNAHSAYDETADSIPNEFNFSEITKRRGWLNGGNSTMFPAPLATNEYFDRLGRRGYSIRVYQPNYVDFCSAATSPPSSCFSLPANSLSQLPALKLSWHSAATFIGLYWITETSSLYYRVRGLYENRVRPGLLRRSLPAPHWKDVYLHLNQASALGLADKLIDDIRTTPDLRGTAFFAHLLVPHFPYYLDEHCNAVFEVSKLLEPSTRLRKFSPEIRRIYYQAYMSQLRCATRKVEELVGLLDSRGMHDAVIIVQGDHGSRIGIRPIDSSTSKQTFKDFFSTLFAIRAPGISSGIDESPVTPRDILDDFTATGSAESKHLDDDSHIFLPGKASKLVRTEIPESFLR